MTKVETLKAELHAAIDAQSDEDLLEGAKAYLENSNIPMATEEEERRIGLAMEDIAAGRVMSLEDFIRRSDEKREARTARSQQPHE